MGHTLFIFHHQVSVWQRNEIRTPTGEIAWGHLKEMRCSGLKEGVKKVQSQFLYRVDEYGPLVVGRKGESLGLRPALSTRILEWGGWVLMRSWVLKEIVLKMGEG